MPFPKTPIFKAWQSKILFGVFFGYTAYHMLRLNLAMAMPSLKTEFALTNAEAGWIFSGFTFAYAMGRLVNGFLSDKNNARYFMTLGLVLCAALNLCFLGVHSYIGFLVLWTLNGWFQTMGGPASSRMLTHWFPAREMGTKWALWSCSNPVGGGITFLVTGALITSLGWKVAFVIPAVIACLFVPVLLWILRDRPEDVFGPALHTDKPEKNADTPSHPDDVIEARNWPTADIFKQVLANKNIWLICLASFSLYFVRTGFLNWCPVILKELRGFSPQTAGQMGFIYEMGGLAGGLLAGWISDKMFQGRRGPVGFFFMSSLTLVIYGFWAMPVITPWIDTVMMVMFGFFSFGPQVLVGVAAADFATKKAVGVGTGIVGSCGYLGATCSGFGVGQLIDHFGGWHAGLVAFAGMAFLGSVAFGLTSLSMKKQRIIKESQDSAPTKP